MFIEIYPLDKETKKVYVDQIIINTDEIHHVEYRNPTSTIIHFNTKDVINKFGFYEAGYLTNTINTLKAKYRIDFVETHEPYDSLLNRLSNNITKWDKFYETKDDD